MGTLARPRHAYCDGQGNPMGMLLRPRQAAAKAKECRHRYAVEAKACMLPWPGQSLGHIAKDKACIQGQSSMP